jgi:hypothetical protein
MADNLTVHLFQCSPKSEASGSGTLLLTPGTGGAYTAQANINFAGIGPVTANLSGSSATAGGRTLINLTGGRIQVTLVDNPFISRPTFGGCAALDSTYIYNITATP